MKPWLFAVFFGLSILATGQQATPRLEFEVASIKASAPTPMGRMMIRMGVDAEMLRYTNVSLKDMIRIAYRVKEFQVDGPEWLEGARFDIVAKLPEGAKEEQVPEMLQALLAERFQLKLHRETKERGVLVLVPGKDGPKLKPADESASITSGPGAGGPGAGGPGGGAQFGRGPGGPGPGGPGAPGMPRGGMRMMMSPQGITLNAPSASLGNLAEMLSRFTERPVVDQTGIEGQYEFDLSFMPENSRMMPGGMRPPMPPGGAPPSDTPMERAGSVYDAVQKYGLKLEGKKAPMEVLVVDQIEKSPSAN